MPRRRGGPQKTPYGGRLYDSGLEAEVAQRLDLLRHAGVIDRWHPQVPYELIPAIPGVRATKTRARVKGEPAIKYYADFEIYLTASSSPLVLEVKGYERPIWRLKRRLFLYRYPQVPLLVARATAEVLPLLEAVERAA